VLAREADEDGLARWVRRLDAGVTRQAVAKGFWESVEHRGMEVDSFYATYLHRTADAGGRASWVRAFESGLTETEVALGFLTSEEYRVRHPGTTDFVNALYADVLKRPPDAGGLAHWMTVYQQPQGRAAVANGILNSTENFLKTLDRYYADFLDRPPDETGRHSWLFQLESHRGTLSSVAEGILSSEEFFARSVSGG
jgi:hypothetical protein